MNIDLQTLTSRDLIMNINLWTALNPSLSISKTSRTLHEDQIPLPQIKKELEQFKTEGYMELNQFISLDLIKRLRLGIENILSQGLPPVFCFVYDDYWECVHKLKGVFKLLLDNKFKMLPDFWAWYINPENSEVGWAPHRDKGPCSISQNGKPKSLTAWIPITEANPLNGCMYVVPISKDANYLNNQKQGFHPDLQSIRALPVLPGDALIWNQAMYHWGGRSSKYSKSPRISVAFEFQRSDVTAFNNPLLDISKILPLRVKLGLIGQQILQYKHMYGYSEDLVNIAKKCVANI